MSAAIRTVRSMAEGERSVGGFAGWPADVEADVDFWESLAQALRRKGVPRPSWWDERTAEVEADQCAWRARQIHRLWNDAQAWSAVAEARADGHPLDIALMLALPEA
ncbi:hypothetical protein GCM10009721_39220 [Terrabacter tumescens]|uniref:Uncharacterized protein n=1 Tax=Terrabacter tumescens TaxID=60443 RepID=A0ABQ2IIG8_9MICO|nr:hypothetical protein GCM10009721_39220 [Terrabacter tumescens]